MTRREWLALAGRALPFLSILGALPLRFGTPTTLSVERTIVRVIPGYGPQGEAWVEILYRPILRRGIETVPGTGFIYGNYETMMARTDRMGRQTAVVLGKISARERWGVEPIIR